MNYQKTLERGATVFVRNEVSSSFRLISISVGIAVALLVYAASPLAFAQSWLPRCDETRTGQYTFEGLSGSVGKPVQIYQCLDVTCSTKNKIASVTQDTYTAPTPHDVVRPYFAIERRGTNRRIEQRIIGARRLALQGAYNFRDLGGYETQDGKWTRWGQIFRSDELARLTAADYDRLNALHISLVVDLREGDERVEAPTKWLNGSPVFVLDPVADGDNGLFNSKIAADLEIALKGVGLPVETRTAAFEKNYVDVALDSAPKFGVAIRALEMADGSSVFHCAGGRDRTGITTAFLFRILNISDQVIFTDWLLSTKYLDEAPGVPHPVQTDAEIREHQDYTEALRLKPRFLEAVFKSIDERYGNFDNYRREALHITDADVDRLKARLLEKHTDTH